VSIIQFPPIIQFATQQPGDMGETFAKMPHGGCEGVVELQRVKNVIARMQADEKCNHQGG
jgi:hypothetical protein